MTAKIEIFDTTKLNYAGYGPIGVYVNIGYEPLPEGYKTLPDSQFDSYKPDPGYLKNTGLRTPLFTGAFTCYLWRWCQVLECVFDALGVIEELRSPCDCRG